MPTSPCPSDDDLLAFAQGQLGTDRSSDLQRHLAGCESCGAAVAEAARGLAGTSLDADEDLPPRPAAPPASQELKPGDRLGRYSILELLGKGAMGVVYAAYDPQLDRRVALKVLRPDPRVRVGREELQARLLREAQAMARLRHPNVLAIHDAVQVDGGVFLSIELVRGGTLRGWLAQKQRTPAEVLGVFRQAGEGLAAAHRAGIVHRDFKADNVLIDEAGQVFVTDFGVARVGEAPEAQALLPTPPQGSLSLTQTGAMVGTPAYMAPEQLRGEPADARSDIFGFCVALYEALHGAHPYPAKDLASLRAAISEGRVRPPPAKKGVPGQVQRAILKGLRPAPDERFQTMDELLGALSHSPAQRARLVLGAALAVALIAAGALAVLRYDAGKIAACQRGDGRLDRTFDERRQQAVRAAFERSGSPLAAAAFSSVQEGLRKATADILAARGEACASTHERRESSADLLDRRMQCLDDRLQDVSALVDAFAKADATTVERSSAAVQGLGDPAACADRRRLLESTPLPASQEARARISAVREQVAHLAALHQSGRYREGLPPSAKVVKAAEETGYAPLEAEALYWRGRLLFDGNEQPLAPGPLTASAAAASRARRDDLAALAESQLVYTLGWAQKLDEALRWAEHARAVIARSGDDPLLLADLLHARAYAQDKAQHTTEALADARAALALLEKHAQASPARVVPALLLVSRILGNGMETKEAVAVAERGLPLAERTFGLLHPICIDLRTHLGNSYALLGDQRRALPLVQQALADRVRLLGPDHLEVARGEGTVGNVLLSLGRIEEALAHYAEAVRLIEAKLGKEHPELIANLGLSADPLARLGRFEEAHAAVDRAEALARRHQSGIVYAVLLVRAGVEELEGRSAASAATWAEAQALLEKLAPDHPDLAACKAGIARHWRRSGRLAEATAAHAALLAEAEKRVGKDSRELNDLLHDLGEDLLAQGKPAEALPLFERALGKIDPEQSDPLELAEARFAVARALWADPSQRTRALSLAREAQRGMALSKAQRGTLRRDLPRWLSEREALAHR